MVAAPLMSRTSDIDLPVASGAKSLAGPRGRRWTVAVKRTGRGGNSNVELYLGTR